MLGGGLGVPYVEGEEAPTIAQWGNVAARRLPGPRRALATSASSRAAASSPPPPITVYTVGTVKHIPGVRTYVAVDGGMSDNPRPVLYGSGYEAFLPRAVACRSAGARPPGRQALRERRRPHLRRQACPRTSRVGDLLATPVTGAYGHSMASNYNKLTRPPVVFVQDGTARLVVRRETYEDLVQCDVG